MSVRRPYDYPGSPLVVDGGLTVELAHGGDGVELMVEVDDSSWASIRTREEYRTISRADWLALVAYVAAEHARLDAA